MKIPNPSGMRRDTFWDNLPHAKRASTVHWSYDPRAAAKYKGIARRVHEAALLANI